MLKNYCNLDDLLIQCEIVQETVEWGKQDMSKFSNTHLYSCEIVLVLE